MLRPEIWVLEDDPSCQFTYQTALSAQYNCRFFEDVADFAKALSIHPQPMLVIADLMLKQSNFLDFFSTEASKSLYSDVIIVSGLDDMDVLRECYEEGALDYLTKPFNKNQLLAKVEKLCQEKKAPRYQECSTPKTVLTVDPGKLKAYFQDRTISLTHKECLILQKINEAKAITKDSLLASIWPDVKVGRKTLDVHLFNLRNKLKPLDVSIQFEAPNVYKINMRIPRVEKNSSQAILLS